MKSVRLSTSMKESLRSELIKHAFSPRVMDLIQEHREHANAVFNDVVEPGLQVRLGELPEGWVPEVENIKVQFGDSGSRLVDLSLDGRQQIYGELVQALARGDVETLDRVRRRLPHHLKEVLVKVYDLEHPLSEAWTQVWNKRQDLVKEITAAQSTVRATLDSFTTVGSLIRGWPEVAPFAARWNVEPRRLPVVPRDALNSLLDLPVEEAA